MLEASVSGAACSGNGRSIVIAAPSKAKDFRAIGAEMWTGKTCEVGQREPGASSRRSHES